MFHYFIFPVTGTYYHTQSFSADQRKSTDVNFAFKGKKKLTYLEMTKAATRAAL